MRGHGSNTHLDELNAVLVGSQPDMVSDDDDSSERQLRDQELVSKFVQSRLKPTETIYQQAITSLWLGNGAAAGAALTFIGATWKDGRFPHQLLWPLTFFVLGLISMGIGTLAYLANERTVVRQMERANSWLEFHAGGAKSPTEKAGLTFKDWRTRMAIVSGGLFVLGCLIGLSELWFATP
jgi:hypothetical protein